MSSPETLRDDQSSRLGLDRWSAVAVPDEFCTPLREAIVSAGLAVRVVPNRRKGERRSNDPDDHRPPSAERRDAEVVLTLGPDETRALIASLTS